MMRNRDVRNTTTITNKNKTKQTKKTQKRKEKKKYKRTAEPTPEAPISISADDNPQRRPSDLPGIKSSGPRAPPRDARRDKTS